MADSGEQVARQAPQEGERPDVRCPMCERLGGVHIGFAVTGAIRYVKGRCTACSAHWSFPDRRYDGTRTQRDRD